MLHSAIFTGNNKWGERRQHKSAENLNTHSAGNLNTQSAENPNTQSAQNLNIQSAQNLNTIHREPRHTICTEPKHTICPWPREDPATFTDLKVEAEDIFHIPPFVVKQFLEIPAHIIVVTFYSRLPKKQRTVCVLFQQERLHVYCYTVTVFFF